MADQLKNISVASTWQLTWQMLGTIRKSVVPVCFFVVLLPAMAIKFLLGWWSIPTNATIKAFTSDAGKTPSAPNYYELFSAFSSFIIGYSGAVIVIVGFAAIAYLAVARIAIEQQVNHRLISPGRSILEALYLFFPKGLVLLVMIAVLSLEQFFIGPFHIFTVFALVAPILMMVEKQSAFASLKNALFFKYSSPQTGGAFLVSFVMLVLSIIIYLSENFLHFLFQFILSADEFLNVPRYWWLTKLPGLPFSLVYAIADIICTAGYIFLGVFFALFVNAVFFQVRLKVSERY